MNKKKYEITKLRTSNESLKYVGKREVIQPNRLRKIIIHLNRPSNGYERIMMYFRNTKVRLDNLVYIHVQNCIINVVVRNLVGWMVWLTKP